MYKYYVAYSLVGMLPDEVTKEQVIWADDREEALEKAHKIMMKAIQEERAEPNVYNTWATLSNSKGKVIAWLCGNYAQGFFWKQKSK